MVRLMDRMIDNYLLEMQLYLIKLNVYSTNEELNR
jgi:hypothetical protein